MSRPEHDSRVFVSVDFAPPRIRRRTGGRLLILLGLLGLVALGAAVTQLLLR